MKSIRLFIGIAAAGFMPVWLAASQSPSVAVEAELARIAKAMPAATIGVSAVDLQGGASVALKGDDWFPMASTYKVPIAAVALERVARGQLSLDQMVPLRPVDLRPGSDLSMMFQHPGAAISAANLIDLSISISDNTAADRVLALAGGPAAVTARLRAWKITDINVDRSTLQSLLAFVGAEGAIADEEFTFAAYNKLTSVSSERHTEAALRAAEERRDAATPRAMSEFLRRLAKGELLPKAETEFLIGTMTRARGATRIRGMLPPGVARAPHKSGTLLEGQLSYVNDVGILRLPDGRQVAIAVFIKNSRAPLDVAEQMIAHLTRTVYDHFVVTRQ